MNAYKDFKVKRFIQFLILLLHILNPKNAIEIVRIRRRSATGKAFQLLWAQKYSNISVPKAIEATPPVALIASIMTVSIAFFGLNSCTRGEIGRAHV